MNSEPLLTQTQLVERGWTKSMIPRFLPDPILKPNPMYKSASPMKLYREEDVLAAEKTTEFSVAKEKAERRKVGAQKAVETKTKGLRADVERFLASVNIDSIPYNELRFAAIDAKQKWYDDTDQWEKCAIEADEETKDRWCVNYIRHNLTHYDEQLWHMKGKTGTKQLYPEFKIALLRKIAEIYPRFRDEIERQIATTY